MTAEAHTTHTGLTAHTQFMFCPRPTRVDVVLITKVLCLLTETVFNLLWCYYDVLNHGITLLTVCSSTIKRLVKGHGKENHRKRAQEGQMRVQKNVHDVILSAMMS